MNQQRKILKKKHLRNTLLNQALTLRQLLKICRLLIRSKRKYLGNIIAEVFKRFKITETSKMLDRMKDLGFKYSTKAGITVGVADIVVLAEKEEIIR